MMEPRHDVVTPEVRQRTGPCRPKPFSGNAYSSQVPVTPALIPRSDTSHHATKNGVGMWPECGVEPAAHSFQFHGISPRLVETPDFTGLEGSNLASEVLTGEGPAAY